MLRACDQRLGGDPAGLDRSERRWRAWPRFLTARRPRVLRRGQWKHGVLHPRDEFLVGRFPLHITLISATEPEETSTIQSIATVAPSQFTVVGLDVISTRDRLFQGPVAIVTDTDLGNSRRETSGFESAGVTGPVRPGRLQARRAGSRSWLATPTLWKARPTTITLTETDSGQKTFGKGRAVIFSARKNKRSSRAERWSGIHRA